MLWHSSTVLKLSANILSSWLYEVFVKCMAQG